MDLTAGFAADGTSARRRTPARAMMQFDSFRTVEQLEEATLRTLVRSGDAPERVWAAWALALRLGEVAVGALTASSQPDPGVRAHLIVVLAGYGEYNALRALAAEDPDPVIRATACEYIIRTAAADAIQPIASFLEERLRMEASSTAVVTVLRALPPGWPLITDGVLESLLGHPASDVRLDALTYLARQRPDQRPVDIMRQRLTGETEPAVLIRVAELLSGEQLQAELIAAAERVPESAEEILDLLGVVDLPMASLGSLPWHPDPGVRLKCIQLSSALRDAAALEWLAAQVTADYVPAAEASRSDPREQARRDGFSRLRRAAEDRIIALLSDPAFSGHRIVLPALQRMLDDTAAELSWILSADDGEDMHDDHWTSIPTLLQRHSLLKSAVRAGEGAC